MSNKFNARALAGAALAAALLAGCGSGGDDDAHGAAPPPAGPVAQTVSNVVAYINTLIAGGADNAEPIDIGGLTLATDDSAEAAPLE